LVFGLELPDAWINPAAPSASGFVWEGWTLVRFASRACEALELLASDPHGATEAFMHARGFSLKTLLSLVRRRLATVQREIVIAGSERVVATRIKITDAGRKAIE
jgi:hypothetical protein